MQASKQHNKNRQQRHWYHSMTSQLHMHPISQTFKLLHKKRQQQQEQQPQQEEQVI